MNLRGIGADAGLVLRAWARSPAAIVVTIVMPLIFLLAFGFIFGASSTTPPRLAVEDLDGSPGSKALRDALAGLDGLTLADVVLPEGADPAAWMRETGAPALLRIPPGFGAAPPGAREARLLVEEGDAAHADVLRLAVEAALARAADPAPEPGPVLAVERTPSAGRPVYVSFLLPGIMGLNAVSVGLFTSTAAVTQLRQDGLLARLAVSPFSKRDWLLGRMLGQSVITVVVAVPLLLVARLALDATFSLSLWTALLLVAGTLVFVGLGTIVGSAFREPQTANGVSNLVYFPMALVSGSFFDVARLPDFLQWLPQASPLTYLNDGLRADMLAGDAERAAIAAGILLLMALVLVAAGSRLVRWSEK